ncbi:MAG: hypothetical protein Q8900_08960 [Bacillota bacterium]|nr:hypothetical protein [Bacillota bacterium]
MIKKSIVFLTLLIVPIALFQGCKKSTDAILTDNLSNVTNIHVDYTDKNKTDTTINDKKLVKKVYDSIISTKTDIYKNPNEKDAQNSNPAYTIQINYTDGKNDLIKSTETGEFIYRTLDDKGSWAGGKNLELEKLISQ